MLISIGGGILLAVAPLSSQRSFSATYDTARQITLRGTVTRIDWVNPHAFFFIDVAITENGVGRNLSEVTQQKVQPSSAFVFANWAVEFGDPLDLERNGWKPGALRIGDQVTVDGVPAAGERRQAFAKSVVVVRTGKRIFAAAASPPPAVAAREPAPRWPDGHVRLGAAPGRKGYWGAPSVRALIERSAATVRVNNDGLLANLADVDKVAPFQSWARAVYERRQQTRLKDDPLGRCLPPGGPRQFQLPEGFQFVEQPEVGRILVLLGGGDRNWRVIYTDGRPLGQAAEQVPSYYGTSVGRWERDALIVESVGYNEKFWMTAGGLPHTEALRLTERFTRPDAATLKYDVTVDDPRTYTRPWSGGWTIRWIADREISEYFCEENAESTFIR